MHQLSFSDRLLQWFRQHGRTSLPWQQNPDPYRVWVSEIMLQQTQVNTVIPYYQRFMEHFSNLKALAEANQDKVLHHWTGLGYYARARNLHKAAAIIHFELGDCWPESVEELSELPGIGKSTAGAIMSLGMDKRAVILDGNVKRVLTRYHCIEGWPDKPGVQKELWALAEQHTPRQPRPEYTQAIMDLGASLCSRTRPACNLCPLNETCRAFQENRTDEFPHKKPKKTLPVKATYMLIFYNKEQGQVLLERRPPQGIWGGLWSFPEAESIEHLNDTISRQVMTETSTQQHWKPFRHTFSHYHLDITPVVMSIDTAHVGVMENDRCHWYDLKNPAQLGLAAPVKKLLGSLEN